ncbi:MAG: hypothetical protein ACRCYU_03320 [Nocardioides sp.]
MAGATALEALEVAALRLGEATESARAADDLMWGVSPRLAELARHLVIQAEDVRVRVVRARDGLGGA